MIKILTIFKNQNLFKKLLKLLSVSIITESIF